MPRSDSSIHPYYTRPAVMTSVGRYAHLLDPLPRKLADLAAVAHGLLVHGAIRADR